MSYVDTDIITAFLISEEKMKYSNEEIQLITECLALGNAYKEIVDFIYEDFGIYRSADSLSKKCIKLGFKSLNGKKKTHKQFIEEMEIINPNINILGEYINNHTKIKCSCNIDGHIWYVKPKDLLNGGGCPKCAGNILKTHNQFVEEISIINPNINILGEYINNHTKIKCLCNIDNHTWKPAPNDLLRGSGCPKCANRNQGGGYQNMSKEQADNLGYSLYLYRVKLQYEGELFYKYGLTKHSDRRRFKKYKPYTVIEELSFIEYDAWTAICKEKALKSNYTPKYKFGGWTECFKLGEE